MEYKPVEISEFSETSLYILWEDNHQSIYLYEDLRQICPCASCKKSSAKPNFKKKILLGKVRPLKIENVGQYAVKFYWSDKHDTGIYTYDFLREICPCENCTEK